ncbi:MAG: YcaO-like family protein [Desulfobulbaceae bacterium]|nr:YcaO-like family protein [Desulfobulbaceae bacterium]
MEKKPIRPTDSFKTYTLDQDKVCTPAETVERFQKRLAEIDLDILQGVSRIDNGRLDIPVYFSVCGKDAFEIIGEKKQMGKGSTPDQSKASACMELAERFSFFSFKNNPDNFITGSYSELEAAGHPLMPLETILQSVHDTTTDETSLKKLLEDVPIQWTWATNLTKNKEVLIPFNWFFAINEFNGPSAGNSYEEAIIQGVSEIVERHVSAVISHDKIRVPLIDPGSVKGEIAKELVKKFKDNSIEFYLSDFTHDTGIPTVTALAIDRSTFPETSEIVLTAGTAPDPEKALIRAMTEVAQLSGDFNTGANYVASGLPKPLSMDEVDYITDPGVTIDLDDMPDISDNNLKVEIENCLTTLNGLGMEVYAVNTTHPKLQVPAIYAIVPGAHFRERSRISNAGLFAAKLVAEQITDPEESNRRLLKMAGMLPKSYFIEFYLGRNMLALSRHEEALHHFEQALKCGPEEEDLPYIYSYMGSCLKDMEHYNEAIDVLAKGTDLDDERPDIHNLLGVCHFKLEEYETAITHFKRTVELNPSSAMDYANLGINYRRIGKDKEAAGYFKLALTLDPSITFARDNLAEILAQPAPA